VTIPPELTATVSVDEPRIETDVDLVEAYLLWRAAAGTANGRLAAIRCILDAASAKLDATTCSPDTKGN
jgi:hypothetical protein